MLIKQDRDNYWKLNFLDKYMVGHKGFICGGCFKNIFNDEKVKDLDIFFESESDYQDAVEYFDKRTVGYSAEIYDEDKEDELYTFVYENKNIKAYKDNETGVRLELCHKIFGTPEQILSQFDFTIVKFAFYKEKVFDTTLEDDNPFEDSADSTSVDDYHIEYKVLFDDKFFEHLHMKRLVIDNNIPYPMSTLERMFRYSKYGYMPCKETKLKIVKALRELNDKAVEVSESLYDGMD